MNKRVLLVITVLLLSTTVVAQNSDQLSMIPAAGDDVSLRVSDTLAYYHDFTLDHYWTGSDQWAVNFDMTDYFLGVPCEFRTEAVWIYLPEIANPSDVTIAFAPNYVNQPDLGQSSNTTTLNSSEIVEGWNRIPVSTYQDSIIWLLIDYETDNFENFLCGSFADGTQSYYENDGYYYDFSAQGIESELLVSLEGHFIIDKIDLELLDFALSGEMAQGNSVYPVLRIRNDSNSYIDSVNIAFSILRGSVFESFSLVLDGELAVLNPNQTYNLDFSDDEEMAIALLETPAQYNVTVTVSSNDDEFTLNNSESLKFQIFDEVRESYLLENIIDLDQEATNDIWTLEESYLTQNGIELLNYFPGADDLPFYNIHAIERFSFYELNGYPATIFNGDKKLTGYWGNYDDQFSELFTEMMLNNYTWITFDSLNAEYSAISDSSSIDLYFSNTETKMLVSYLNHCNFYAYLVEDFVQHEGEIIPGSIMIRKMKYIAQFGDNSGTTFDARIAFKMSELPYISDFENCKILYIIQNEETKSIDYFGLTDYLVDIEYEGTVSGEEDEIPEAEISLDAYPNPFQSDQGINFKISGIERSNDQMELEIYNIKGQKIISLNSDTRDGNKFVWNGLDKNQNKSATGIYFVRVNLKSGGKVRTSEKKILLLNE